MPLHIREMRKNDLEPMYQLLSDPAVMKYLEPPFTKEKTESFLNTCGLTTNPRIYAVDHEEGFTGYVIFHEYDEDSLEIGWVLFPRYWGQGYASELTRQLIEKSLQTKKTLIIECDPEQTVSGHIAEKYGFIYQGRKNGLDIYRRDA